LSLKEEEVKGRGLEGGGLERGGLEGGGVRRRKEFKGGGSLKEGVVVKGRGGGGRKGKEVKGQLNASF
jgi:hypothetical protein